MTLGVPLTSDDTRHRLHHVTSPPRWLVVVTTVVVGATAAVTLLRLVTYYIGDSLISYYKLPMFWVDYGDGFVRRGLPGAVLGVLTGGDPTLAQVNALGLAMSAAAVGALGWLVSRLVGRVSGSHRLLVVALVGASPFTVAHVLNDLGRYDAVVLLAIVIVAALGVGDTASRYPAATAVGLALLTAGAAAVLEMSLLVLAPLLWLLTARWRLAPGRRALLTAAMVSPAAVVSAIALTTRPDPTWLAQRIRSARDAGVPWDGDVDAADALASDSAEQWAVFANYDPLTLGLTWLLLAIVAILAGWTLWRLLGSPEPRAVGAVAGAVLLTVIALSAVGVDVVRWWAFAFITFVAALVMVAHRAGGPPEPVAWSRARSLVMVAVLVLGIVAHDTPISPVYLPVLRLV